MAITIARLPLGIGAGGGSLAGAGCMGTGTTGRTLGGGLTAAGAPTGAGLLATGGLSAAAPSASLSYRSTTRRWPYCWLGARLKLFGETAADRSITRRKSVGLRCAERMLVIGVLLSDSVSSLVANCAPATSMTIRSGALRVNTLCCTGPDRSNTRRVLSGARHSRTLRKSAAAASASPSSNANSTPSPAVRARTPIAHPIIVVPWPEQHTTTHRARPGAAKTASERPLERQW